MLKYLTTMSAMLLLAAGCGTDGYYQEDATPGEIATLTDGIAIHRTDNDTVYYFSGNLKKPVFTELFEPDPGERIVWFEAGPDPSSPDTLFVMTEPSDPRDISLDERLYRVKAGNGKTTMFTAGSRYDEIVFGPRQRFAILYHGEKNVSAGLYNPNEVSLIDLTAGPSKTNPQTLSVSMDGRKIDKVAFVPNIHVGGIERELAIFMAGSIVRIVDLNDPEGTWAKIPLLPKTDTTPIRQEQLIAVDETEGCEDASCEAKLFIRATGTNDIFYISLGRSGEGFVDPQTKQLEAGGFPTDMAIVSEGGATYLVAMSPDNAGTKVNFIDVDTSEPFSIIIADRLRRMQLIEDEENAKLVLFADNGNQGVHFLSLADIAKERGRNLETFPLQGSVSVTVNLDEHRLLLVPNNWQDLVILDLLTEKGERLSSSGEYDWQGAEIFDDMFFVLPESTERVDYFDLSTGRPNSLLLDDTTTSLHLLKGQKAGVAFHNTASGRLTLFPLGDPTRAKAKVIDGLWLTGCLNREGV